MKHEIKAQERNFNWIRSGRKTFEITRANKEYRPGDEILFREWSDIMNSYTGRTEERIISYIYSGGGQYGLAPGYIILALLKKPEAGKC